MFFSRIGGGVNEKPLFAKIDPVSRLNFRCPLGVAAMLPGLLVLVSARVISDKTLKQLRPNNLK